MAYYRLAAAFFVGSDGVVTPKAPVVPRKLSRRIYERDGGKCRQCGCAVKFGGSGVFFMDKLKASATDHILARSRGGQNDESNLRLLCITCNSQKGAK
jgi:5-methylcytosine-specific restriction endonuclease McrA